MADKRVSIAFRIIAVALFSVAIILPTAIFSSVMLIRNLLHEDITNRTNQSLEYNFELVAFQLNRVGTTLKSIAKDPAIAAVFSSQDEELEAVFRLDGFVNFIPSIENIAVQNQNCTLATTDSSFSKEYLYNFFVSDYCRGYGRDELLYVSARFQSALSGAPAVVMSTPVRSQDGREIGFVSAVIDIGEFDNAIAPLQMIDEYTVVLDRNRELFLDSRAPLDQSDDAFRSDPILRQVLQRMPEGEEEQNGIFVYNLTDSSVVVGYQYFSDRVGSLTVINVKPRALAYRLEQRIITGLSLTGVAMLLALALSLWITVKISTRRLDDMSRMVKRYAKTREYLRLPEDLCRANDEVGVLGRSFNEMIDAVERGRLELQLAKAKSDAILVGIGDGVVAVDAKGRIILFNKAAEHITSFSASAVMGKHYSKVLRFLDEKTGAPVDEFFQRAFRGKMAIMPQDIFLKREDGSLVPVADSCGPILSDDQSIDGVVIVFRDVSREREVDRMKTEFVSLASHQLRTPLTAIRWYLEDLQSGELGWLSAEQQENIGQAASSTRRMIRLVEDLLNVSRLESGRLSVNPQPTDLAALIAEVIAEQSPSVAEHGCQVSLRLPKTPLPLINIDPILVRQVATNLISNAIKYTAPVRQDGKVEVELSKNGRNFLRVSVRDNGMGISEKDKDRLFQRFFRSDEAVRQQAQGSGLGLYIAKLLIEASHGMISFDSQEGEGSVFWFLLPIAGSKKHEGGKKLET